MNGKGYNYSLIYKHKKTYAIPKTPIKFQNFMSVVICLGSIVPINLLGLILVRDKLPIISMFSVVFATILTSILTDVDSKSNLPVYLLKWYEYKQYSIIYVDGVAIKLAKFRKEVNDNIIIINDLEKGELMNGLC